ncbi:PIN domain-containing protein [Paracidobacterium acidisoli]|uniref:PIN domain-containing protein n=1 Tax=Paracidobacterium acidisoli TaxID=2303751 RepID=UPI003315B798
MIDANILIRAVFGRRVRRILETSDKAVFCCPEFCIEEARKRIPVIAERQSRDRHLSLLALDKVSLLITPVQEDFYQSLYADANARIASRDPDDWPIVATALFLNLAIWTEDLDFFGCGLPTWTTDRVEIYLRD